MRTNQRHSQNDTSDSPIDSPLIADRGDRHYNRCVDRQISLEADDSRPPKTFLRQTAPIRTVANSHSQQEAPQSPRGFHGFGGGLKSWRDAERGMSSVALFILALPLLIVAFGYGFDSLRLVYIKETLQGRLDLAAQAGVSVTTTAVDSYGQRLVTLGDPGEIDGNAAKVKAWSIYKANTEPMRTSGKILTCPDPAWNVPPTPGEDCAGEVVVVGQPLDASRLCEPLSDPANRYGLTYTVNESVDAVFLKMVNVGTFHLDNISATALVRAKGC